VVRVYLILVFISFLNFDFTHLRTNIVHCCPNVGYLNYLNVNWAVNCYDDDDDVPKDQGPDFQNFLGKSYENLMKILGK